MQGTLLPLKTSHVTPRFRSDSQIRQDPMRLAGVHPSACHRAPCRPAGHAKGPLRWTGPGYVGSPPGKPQACGSTAYSQGPRDRSTLKMVAETFPHGLEGLPEESAKVVSDPHRAETWAPRRPDCCPPGGWPGVSRSRKDTPQTSKRRRGQPLLRAGTSAHGRPARVCTWNSAAVLGDPHTPWRGPPVLLPAGSYRHQGHVLGRSGQLLSATVEADHEPIHTVGGGTRVSIRGPSTCRWEEAA